MSFVTKATAPAMTAAEDLLDFIAESPTMFHSAAAIRARLDAAGFTYLSEGAAWEVRPGGAYYTQRNGSSVVAWRVGERVAAPGFASDVAKAADAAAGSVDVAAGSAGDSAPYHFQLTASHSDSPCFKVKTNGELEGPAGYVRLDTEAYGGMMDYTWFDRPLSLAGRVLVREGARIESCLVALNRDVALIPSLAIHMDGGVNKGFAPNRASDLFPLLSAGSETKQGAASTLLADTLSRVNAALGFGLEEYVRALSASMLVSCDNAHAQHPAHPELADSLHAPQVNGGIVVKEAANQHYCTDAFSRAAFTAVLDDAEIPHQAFANRSDKAGGSTLGNISNMQVSVHGVDVGCAQLSMHSCMETAGARDVDLAIEALTAFYDTNVRIDGADSIELG